MFASENLGMHSTNCLDSVDIAIKLVIILDYRHKNVLTKVC